MSYIFMLGFWGEVELKPTISFGVFEWWKIFSWVISEGVWIVWIFVRLKVGFWDI